MRDRLKESMASASGCKREQNLRIGVYVCHCGGNISDVVDVQKVADAASRLDGVVVARHHSAMCSQAGQDLVINDIREENLDRVVIAACTPGLHEHTFRAAVVRAGQNPYLYEHVNIREQVSWCSKSDPQGATRKAIQLVAAGVAKSRLLQPLSPFTREVSRHVTVIGGGVSGLRAARDLSRGGFAVTLLEKSAVLGGHVLQWDRVYPTGKKGTDLIHELIDEVIADQNIVVHMNAELSDVSGCAGDFHLVGRYAPSDGNGQPGSHPFTLHSGAIVLATGFELYEPGKGEFGYGDHPEVITLPQLEHMLAEQGDAGSCLLHNGQSVRSVCLIHCVGSRQIEGIHQPGPDGKIHDYCSRTCCTSTLQAAAALRRRFPDVHVYELYRDIRTYGRDHESYYDAAAERGVIFLRYTPEHLPVVSPAEEAGGYPLRVTVRDTLTFGEEVNLPAGLVVLATGMLPGHPEIVIDRLKLSRSADGFLQEVHPKLRPVELAVRGVFVAGTCQAPMDVSESSASGSAAASKVAALLGKGTIELDPFRAKVDADRCQGEGKCVEACRHQRAVTLVHTGENGGHGMRAEVNVMLCNGCGMCVPACPHQAIQIDGWHLDQFDAIVDALVAEHV
ncbi:MAG: CoB--CoM heterodisulfide reductase iron-sulfur subunit A family protein [Thermoguttaceae bacterium]|nr:CoB--CoM heterodisulfide reductase iron-sulfur subunit A family protein [Thermoguttaceae bacterium]